MTLKLVSVESSIDIKDYVKIRKSRRARKTSLKYRKGLITVVVPEGRDVNLDELIRDNADFFEKYSEEAKKFRDNIPDRDLSPGGNISVLGKNMTFEVEKRRYNKVNDKILLSEHLVERTSFIDQLEKTLRSFAREKFEEKASEYSNYISKDYEKIFVKDQKTRWGSCSDKGNLNFNWRLVLGPEHVLEYVVVHELVHLEEKNHGESFWSRVQEIYPAYEASNSWIEDNSAKLVFDKSEL